MFKLLMGLAVFFLLVCILFFGLRFIALSIASLFTLRGKQNHTLYDVQPINVEHASTDQPLGKQDKVLLKQDAYDHTLKVYDPVTNSDLTLEGHVLGCSQHHNKAYITLALPSGQHKSIAVTHIQTMHNQVTQEHYEDKADIARYFHRFL